MTSVLMEHQRLDHVQTVMGTGVRFTLRRVPDPEAARVALDASVGWLQRVDQVFSTYRSDSAVTRLREGRSIDAHDQVLVDDVLGRCAEAVQISRAAFDPWAVPEGFDPSGLVKGWSLTHVGELLTPVCQGFLVDAGGDVVVHGHPATDRSWSVGVRHPTLPGSLAKVLDLAPAGVTAVATSGDYARPGHITDPRTGCPPSGVLSATVLGPDPGLADALATGMFVSGFDAFEQVVDLPGYEAFLVDSDHRTWSTPGLSNFSRADAADEPPPRPTPTETGRP